MMICEIVANTANENKLNYKSIEVSLAAPEIMDIREPFFDMMCYYENKDFVYKK